ncbi:MAG: helix-turn-helix domain-containing protein [Ruminococcaceae bacterium]|nr:helix-turn-helix domain-containing protein [Oscillospiraceae bacterium]
MSRFFIGVWSRPNSHPLSAPHSHPFYEIILTIRGDGDVAVDEQTFHMRPGRVLIIPPNSIHGGLSEGGYEEIFVQVDSFPALAEELKSGGGLLKNDTDGMLTKLAQSMLYRFVRGKKDTTFSLLYELFFRLLTEKCAFQKNDPVVEEVCGVLARNYNDPELSLAQVLSATGYQKDHIRRRFVSACGITPVEYLTELRIENAKRLLERREEMGLTVAEVALRCGYYDSHYFSKVFKKRVGVTPEHYVGGDSESI